MINLTDLSSKEKDDDWKGSQSSLLGLTTAEQSPLLRRRSSTVVDASTNTDESLGGTGALSRSKQNKARRVLAGRVASVICGLAFFVCSFVAFIFLLQYLDRFKYI